MPTNYAPYFASSGCQINSVNDLILGRITTKIYNNNTSWQSGSIIAFTPQETGNYIYGIEEEYSSGVVDKFIFRTNYKTGIKNKISFMSIIPDEINGQNLNYIAIDDDNGLFIFDEYSYITYSPAGNIRVYDVNWGFLSLTLRATYPYSASEDYYMDNVAAVTDYTGNPKVVMFFYKYTSGSYIGDFLTYDSAFDSFILKEGPSGSSVAYYLNNTYNDYTNNFGYADLGDGRVAFALISYDNLINYNHIIQVDTLTGSYVNTTLPKQISTPNVDGDYYYEARYKIQLAPDYTSGDLYFQIPYKQYVTSDFVDWMRIMKVNSSGVLSLVKHFGDNTTQYLDPYFMPYSKDKIISVYENYDNPIDNYIFYDIFSSGSLFSVPWNRADIPLVSPTLDEITNKIIWSNLSPDRDFNNQYASEGGIWYEDTVGFRYPQAWDWEGWDIVTPYTAWESFTDYIGTHGPGIHLRAQSGSRIFTVSEDVVFSGSANSTGPWGVEITGLTSGSLYMVTPINTYNENITISPDLLSTKMIYKNDSSFFNFVGGPYGENSGGSVENGPIGDYIWADLNGGTIDGLRCPRIFFVYNPGNSFVGDGDVWYGSSYRGDNSGTITYNVYPAQPENLELSISIDLNQIAYTGEIFTVTYYQTLYYSSSSYGANPPLFSRFSYTDGTYYEHILSDSNMAESGTYNLGIPPADNEKTIQKLSIGYYLNKTYIVGAAYQHSYNLSLLITDLSFRLQNSSVIQRVDLNGTPVTLVNCGALDNLYPRYLKLTGSTILYETRYYRTMSYLRELVRQGRFQFIQWD